MNIEWMRPAWLAVFPFLCIFMVFVVKKSKKPLFDKILFTGVRGVVCAALVLAMTGMSVIQMSDKTTTMFVVDASDSTQSMQPKVNQFLSEAEQEKSPKDFVGVICFGENSLIESVPSKDTVLTHPLRSYVDSKGSQIEEALTLAESTMPQKTRKRIVLISDGCETAGDALSKAKALRGQGVDIDVFPLQTKQNVEVQLSDLELPNKIHVHTEYEIGLTIDSNVDSMVHVKLLKGNSLIREEQVHVSVGENKLVFVDKTDCGGSVLYRAELSSQKDTMQENNKAYGYTYIDDVPQILLVEQENQNTQWQRLLKSTQAAVTVASPKSVPTTVDQLGQYDSVILADVPATQFTKGFFPILKSYVKDLGGGLLVTGGEHSYALGEYQNTILEELLPVKMKLRSEGEDPSLGMVLVIDRSGSMEESTYGVSKLELAKEAAIRSLSSFQKKDQLGVIAFDSQPTWAVPLQSIESGKAEMETGIGRIQAGGGTSILPALQEAEKTLKQADTKQKHILLLTDGQAPQEGYRSLMEQMKQEGITLSTVAVGGEADTVFLQNLSDMGNGRYYFTNEFTDLPEIFAKETYLAGKEYIKNRTFYPEAKDSSKILDGVKKMAKLDGYIGTTAKSRADMVLQSDEQEPILATWQYGLGRTSAWTSDVSGKWTGEWLSSQEGCAILRNTVSWVMKKQATEEVQVQAEREGNGCRLTVTMPYQEDIAHIKAKVIAAKGKTMDTTMSMDSPGIYSGFLDQTEEGAYVAQLQVEKNDGTVQTMQSGFRVPFSKEYDIRYQGSGAYLLRQLAEITGGRVLTTGKDVFAKEAQATKSSRDLSVFWMMVAFVFFLLDILLHRFSSLPQKIRTFFCNHKKWIFRKQKDGFNQQEKYKETKKIKITPKQESQQKKSEAVAPKNTERSNTMNQLLAAKRKRKK